MKDRHHRSAPTSIILMMHRASCPWHARSSEPHSSPFIRLRLDIPTPHESHQPPAPVSQHQFHSDQLIATTTVPVRRCSPSHPGLPLQPTAPIHLQSTHPPNHQPTSQPAHQPTSQPTTRCGNSAPICFTFPHSNRTRPTQHKSSRTHPNRCNPNSGTHPSEAALLLPIPMYVLFERFYAALLLFRLYSNAITCYSALLPLIPMYVLFERFCAILLLFP